MNFEYNYLLAQTALQNIRVTDEDIVDYPNGKKRRKVYEKVQYDDQQLKQIQQFKEYANGKLDFNKVDDKTIIRYLYTTDFNQKDCLDKINIYNEWFSNPSIQKFDRITLQLINQGAIYTYGRDKGKRPIIYLNVSIMDMNKYTLDDYLSSINAVVSVVIDCCFIKGKLENYLFIIDTGNKGFSSLPLSTVQQMVLKLSHIYSMRMGKLLIINCNWLIKVMYSTVSPFLAESTKEKINLLSASDVQNGKLKQYIDINEMEQKYAGFRQNLVVKWPPPIPGKERIQKNRKLKQYDFERTSIEEELESQYFSIENNESLFEKYGEHMQLQNQQGCCAAQQCSIM